MSLRWTSYASSKPPKTGSNPQSGRFSNKTAFFSVAVCYKFSLCENRQRQTCKAVTGLFNRAQMVGGDASFNLAVAWSLCDSWATCLSFFCLLLCHCHFHISRQYLFSGLVSWFIFCSVCQSLCCLCALCRLIIKLCPRSSNLHTAHTAVNFSSCA